MRDILTSPRIAEIKRNRRARKIRLVISLFISTIIVIGGLSYYSSNSRVVLNKIIVAGNITINTEDIISRINSQMAGRYIYLFSRANTFIYPRKKIYNDLIDNFPRIEALSVYRDDWNTLHVAITERSGTYLYCGETIPDNKEDIGENCYFVNSSGFIFDKAPYFSGNVYFKYYLKIDGAPENPIGHQVLPPNSFLKMSSFIDGIYQLGFNPVYLLADSTNNYHLYINNDSDSSNSEIIFKSDNDLVAILENLSTAMRKPEFANEINSKYDRLLYIDLRFKNKVLYKFNE